MATPRLLLASASPRRRELLAAAGFKFGTVAPRILERHDIHLTVRELTGFNALRKGLAVARAHPGRVVLSADTLVTLGNEIIGKPRNRKHAAEILFHLSDKVHEVCSSGAILHLARAKATMFYEVSLVRFRRLSKERIASYLAKVNPLDKAGAYAAQGRGAEIIAAIEGSYTNVVGLPMEKTTAALGEFGIRPARPPRSKRQTFLSA
jgi:septum formation protein